MSQELRALAKSSLDGFLEEVRDLNKTKQYEGIRILSPYIKSALEAVRESKNADLSDIYTPLFQKEIPDYEF